VKQVTVKVVFRKTKGSYVLRWKDSGTHAWREKSAKTTVKKEAEKLAAQLEADLQQGRYVEPSNVSWEDFRLVFEGEKLLSLALKSQQAYRVALDRIERILRPVLLSEVDTPAVSRFQARLRAESLSEATIANYLRHVKSALNWAHELGMLVQVPKIQRPPRARRRRLMKGRPITAEEFDRMLAACDKVRPNDAGKWKSFLQGLWLSGLRLGEALELSWDWEAPLSIDLTGKYPSLMISAEAEKGFRDRRLPITPDFAQYLELWPEAQRLGKVFAVARFGWRLDTVSKAICSIGRRAGIIVNKLQGKFASAHDLRRAFGTRWADKLKPADLRLLMRHQSIDTTLKYYVEQDASELSTRIWLNATGSQPVHFPAFD
jgi:integrase